MRNLRFDYRHSLHGARIDIGACNEHLPVLVLFLQCLIFGGNACISLLQSAEQKQHGSKGQEQNDNQDRDRTGKCAIALPFPDSGARRRLRGRLRRRHALRSDILWHTKTSLYSPPWRAEHKFLHII